MHCCLSMKRGKSSESNNKGNCQAVCPYKVLSWTFVVPMLQPSFSKRTENLKTTGITNINAGLHASNKRRVAIET